MMTSVGTHDPHPLRLPRTDRLHSSPSGDRGRGVVRSPLMRASSPRREVRAVGPRSIRPVAEGGDVAARMRWDYDRVVVDITIAGQDAVMRPGEQPVQGSGE